MPQAVGGFTGNKIKKISFPERQKTIEILADGKGIRLDISDRETEAEQ